MVAKNVFPKATISFVRIYRSNPNNTSAESVKGHILSDISPSDPTVRNAGIIHKELINKPVECPVYISAPIFEEEGETRE